MRKVNTLVRGPGLTASMSKSLIDRIKANPRIRLMTRTRIDALAGDAALDKVRWLNLDDQRTETHAIRHVFLITRATPNTAWVKECLALDDKGFVKTGNDLMSADLSQARWSLNRPPHLLETNLPGVFAVVNRGYVRAGFIHSDVLPEHVVRRQSSCRIGKMLLT